MSAVLTHLFIEAVAEGHVEDGLGVQLRHGHADGDPGPEGAGQGQSGRLRPQDRPSPACLLLGGDSRPVGDVSIQNNVVQSIELQGIRCGTGKRRQNS